MAHPKQTIDEGEERAVSPVIGVILMVAITVILAAVIGTFVLDLGQNVQNTGPSASLGFTDADTTFNASSTEETEQDFLIIEHQSGEELAGDEIRIVVRNVSTNAVLAEYDQGDNTTNVDNVIFNLNDAVLTADSTVQVGDTITVAIDPDQSAQNPGTGQDYSVTVVSTETDNRIATGTVEVQ